MTQHNESRRVSPEVAARNKRLAIILGLVAAGFYVGFLFMNIN